MNHKIALVAASLFAFAAAPVAALTPQQERMKLCNAEAKQKALKGDERKSFMSECLSSKKDDKTVAKATQQKN